MLLIQTKLVFLGVFRFISYVESNNAVVVIFKKQTLTVRSHNKKLCWESPYTMYIMDGVKN